MKTILITGGNGMVGHAFQKIQKDYKYNFVFLSRKDGDLSVFNECKKNIYETLSTFRDSFSSKRWWTIQKHEF